MIYLCYDIRGIQSFIFRIPKLKYIIGGSALIDRFDRETMKMLEVGGCSCLFAGGGKGTFTCDSKENADCLKKRIMNEAHAIGLDIRFGISENYEDASKNATEVFPFIPSDLEGKPCPVSGLYPVKDGKPHPIVQKRFFNRGEKMFRWFENRLLKNLPEEYQKAQFFHNVADRDDSGKLDSDGALGAQVLGDRNRWAVICMDGNDMGSQMRWKIKQCTPEEKQSGKMAEWIQKMSSAIDECSLRATIAGISAVLDEWKRSKDNPEKEGEDMVLPIRPLVVGGDDISLLCHVSYAMTFVKTAIEKFNEISKRSEGSWPATGGQITISAGVLFCPVSLPLHTAMGFAELLLASAKNRGRQVFAENNMENNPTPASIDWESVTDSVIDTPAARRQREMRFIDKDTGFDVRLTSRPCTVDEFLETEKLANQFKEIPVSIRHKVLPAMRKPFNERLAFVAEIAKRKDGLAEILCEKDFELKPGASMWVYDDVQKIQKTRVIDAFQLLEEEQRMSKETVDA